MTDGPPTPTADELLPQLATSPDAYPHKIDLNRWMVLVVLLDAASYRAASFLDDRVLGPATRGLWLPVGPVAEAARRASSGRPLHFIFHTGHVGSTLVSRLLDATGAVLSLREPLPLRTLAEAHDALGSCDSLLSSAQFDLLLALFLRLWSRGYDGTQSVIVKATSSAGRLAAAVLAGNAATRAIYMNVAAEPYLATLLAGENSPSDLRGHGPERMRRLLSRSAAPLAPLHALSLGELAALSWLAETWTQREALKHDAGRVMALDFEAFLADVPVAMARVLGHFGLADDPGYLAALGKSPALTRYSKAPEQAYSPAVRAEILRESRRLNRAEIAKGMHWLERQAQADPGVAAILAGGEP